MSQLETQFKVNKTILVDAIQKKNTIPQGYVNNIYN